MNHQEHFNSIQNHGFNSNAFLTLYPGFSYFVSQQSQQNRIAYIETPYSWIGATQPLAPNHDWESLLSEFWQAAQSIKKSIFLFPVERDFADLAQKLGFSILPLGCEPYFDLNRYPHTGKTWFNLIPSTKALHQKGAQIFEVDPTALTPSETLEINLLIQEWLNSRKMSPLGFLNQVKPWTLSEYKRYFILRYQGEILAFLAAIPMWKHHGWYFIDIVKKNHTPPGTTELLILETMKYLKNAGFQKISLGLAPLSQCDPLCPLKTEDFLNISTEKLLHFLYSTHKLYHFQSLFYYKLKFQPSFWKPIFLIYKNKNLKVSPCHSFQKIPFLEKIKLFETLLGHRTSVIIYFQLQQIFKNFHLKLFLESFLKKDIVIQDRSHEFFKILQSLKVTFSLGFMNLVSYFFLNQFKDSWYYSLENLISNPLIATCLPQFFHMHLLHLSTNLIFLIFFTGTLEYFVGSKITLICYLVSTLLSNPLTSLLGHFFYALSPSFFHHPPWIEKDIGSSLGIFGCAGALNQYLIKKGWIVSCLLCGICFGIAWHTHQWIILNHWIAILLGILTSKKLLKT